MPGAEALVRLIWAMQDIVDDDVLRLNFNRCLELGVDQVVLDLQAAEQGRRIAAASRPLRRGAQDERCMRNQHRIAYG